MHLIHRTTCRVCGSGALTKVIDLGEQYLQGAFIKPGSPMPPLRRVPTTVLRCDPARDETACGLLQMAHSVPPNILYSTYWYRSGTNQTMRDHLRGIAEESLSLSGKQSGRVLDIGCNDGTLLSQFPPSYRKYGVDPSDATSHIPSDIHLVRDVFPSVSLAQKIGEEKFDVICSIAMFYDLEDPVGFVKAVRNVLAGDGLWVFEMSYMPAMLRMNSYDTICHEHLEYYSLALLEAVLNRADIKIVKATLNSINGGSVRCHATHKANAKFDRPEFAESLNQIRRDEFDMELDTDKPYRDFQERINVHRAELVSLLKKLKAQGKRIHIYGASTKGNTILQWCGIDTRIVDCAADRNPDKFGATTLGTDIPIVSEAESRKLNPDYYLVLPWHFRDEFVRREREMIDRGVKLIFPLPTIEVFGLAEARLLK